MKIYLLLLSFFFGLRVFGAVTIDNIDVLNDPNRLDQYLLERVDNGNMGARAVPSVDDRQKNIRFKIAPQKTYFGLAASVPKLKFQVLDSGKVTADLWGNFFIGEDSVFEFGGTSTPIGGDTAPARDLDGNLSAGVDGWFQFLPFRAKLYGAIRTSLYAQSRWGDLEKVAESADGTDNGEFTFDPVYSGRLVLASFTIAGGKPQGYDFVNHRLLTTSEMVMYLRRFQGDVMLTTVGTNEASLKANINYWNNLDTGEFLGTIPVFEVSVERTGDLEFALRLETFSDPMKGGPEIFSINVIGFDAKTQQWVSVVPVSVWMGSTPQYYKISVPILNVGIYRFVPNVTGLIRTPAKG